MMVYVQEGGVKRMVGGVVWIGWMEGRGVGMRVSGRRVEWIRRRSVEWTRRRRSTEWSVECNEEGNRNGEEQTDES